MICLTVVSLILLLASASGELVIRKDFPDPCVIIDGDTYHVYATYSNGTNIQHATSTDLKKWTLHPDALPQLGSWANPATKHIWAPYVFRTGNHFSMYYVATHTTTKWQCIGVATGTDLNHFVDKSDKPLICPGASHGAIDPYLFEEAGQRYIVYSATVGPDWRLGVSQIFIQPVNREGDAVTGEPVSMISASKDWEGNVNEAPTLLRHGSKYVLFFSGNSTWDGWYFTGYAISDHIYGPYVKAERPLLTMDIFNGTVIGPGGEDVIRGTDGQYHIFYHGWDEPIHNRMLYVNLLTWDENDRPIVPL